MGVHNKWIGMGDPAPRSTGWGSEEGCSARGGCGPTEIQVVSAASTETTGQLFFGDLGLAIPPSLLHVSLAYEHDGEVDSVWEQIGTKSRENREWGGEIAVIVGTNGFMEGSGRGEKDLRLDSIIL